VRRLTTRLLSGLSETPGVCLHSPRDGTALCAAFNVEGVAPDEAAARLESRFSILCRPGLQCAPAAHRHLGTFPAGAVRLSPGYGNTEEMVEIALEAIRSIVEEIGP
jgi:selenocysteine lyase/cysteine desulfurase